VPSRGQEIPFYGSDLQRDPFPPPPNSPFPSHKKNLVHQCPIRTSPLFGSFPLLRGPTPPVLPSPLPGADFSLCVHGRASPVELRPLITLSLTLCQKFIFAPRFIRPTTLFSSFFPTQFFSPILKMIELYEKRGISWHCHQVRRWRILFRPSFFSLLSLGPTHSAYSDIPYNRRRYADPPMLQGWPLLGPFLALLRWILEGFPLQPVRALTTTTA